MKYEEAKLQLQIRKIEAKTKYRCPLWDCMVYAIDVFTSWAAPISFVVGLAVLLYLTIKSCL